MTHMMRLALFVVAALLIGCQTSNTAFITATADPLVPMPEIPTETATVVPTRAPTKASPPSILPTPLPETPLAELPPVQLGPAPEGAAMRLGIGGINTFAISPDNSVLVVGTTAGLYGYQISTMQRLWQAAVQSEVAGISWMPFGNTIAVRYSASGLVTGLDAVTGAELFVFEHTDDVGATTWSPNGDRLAVAWGGNSGVDPTANDLTPRISVWDIASSTRLFTSEVVTYNAFDYRPLMRRLSWSRDGKLIAGASRVDQLDDNFTVEAAIVWDAQTGDILQIMRSTQMRLVQFLPTSDKLITWSEGSGGDAPRGKADTLIWDVNTGQLLHTLSGEGGYVSDVGWLSDATHLMTLTDGFNSGTAEINKWDLLTGTRVSYLDVEDTELYSMALSPDTSLVAVGGYGRGASGGNLLVADTQTLTPIFEASQDGSWINLVDWGSDSLLVSSSQELLVVYDISQEKVVHDVAGSSEYSGIHTVSWSPYGKTLITQFSGSNLTWLLSDGSLWSAANTRFDLFDESKIDTDVVAPNGALTASGSIESSGSFDAPAYKASVVVRDLQNSVILKILDGPPAEVLHVAWSPDGTMLAAGGGLVGHFQGNPMVRGWVENTIYVWDTTTWELIRTYVGHTGRVNSLAFSPDGTQLASGSSDGTAIIWQVK